MSLDDDNRTMLVKKQMEVSRSTMQDAEFLLKENRVNAAVRRPSGMDRSCQRDDRLDSRESGEQ